MSKKKQKALLFKLLSPKYREQKNQLIKKLWLINGILKVSKRQLKNGLTSINSNFFLIGLLPFIGYCFDTQSNWPSHPFHYLNKTFPTLKVDNIHRSKMSWATFNYTHVFKQLNWTYLKNIRYEHKSIYVLFNSQFKFYRKRQYMGIYSVPSKKLLTSQNETRNNNCHDSKKFFLTGYNFSRFFFNQPELETENSSLLTFINGTDFKNLTTWHHFFSELDDIPFKLQGCFSSSSTLPLMSYSFSFDHPIKKIQRFDYINQHKRNKKIDNLLTDKQKLKETRKQTKRLLKDKKKTRKQKINTKKQQDKELLKALIGSKKQLLFSEPKIFRFGNKTSKTFDKTTPKVEFKNGVQNDEMNQTKAFSNHLKKLDKIKLDCLKDFKRSNLLKLRKTNGFEKNLLPFTLVDYAEAETNVEQKHRRLNHEIYNRIKHPKLVNLRSFYYDIYNSNDVFKNFLCFQLNNFQHKDFSFKKFFNERLCKSSPMGSENKNRKGKKKRLLVDDAKYWQTYLSADIRTLGNTTKTIAFHFQNATYFFPYVNNYRSTIDKDIKPSTLNTNETYMTVHKSLRNQKRISKTRFQRSLIVNFEHLFFDYVNQKVPFQHTWLYDDFLCFGFNRFTKPAVAKKYSRYLFFTKALKQKTPLNLRFGTQNKNPLVSASKQSLINKLKLSIKTSQSPFVNRKVSGYLYPDHQRDELISKTTDFGGFLDWASEDPVSLQIFGGKNQMHAKFKALANSQNKNLLNSILCLNQMADFKSRTVKQNRTFFGTGTTDYYTELIKQNATLLPQRKKPKGIQKPRYKANRSINYTSTYLDSKLPQWFYLRPKRKQWQINNTGYYFSILSPLNASDTLIVKRLKRVKKKFDTRRLKKQMKKAKLKPVHFNCFKINPRTYDVVNIINTKKGIKTNLSTRYEKRMNKWILPTKHDLFARNKMYKINKQTVQKINSQTFQNKFYFDYLNHQNNFIYRTMITPRELNLKPRGPLVYKTHFPSTKQSSVPLSFKTFNTNLYEYITIKKWSVLTQIIFAYSLFRGIRHIQKHHQETLKFAVENFLTDFEFKSLVTATYTHSAIVKPKKQTKFKHLIGGSGLLEQLLPSILLLKKARKPFSKATIAQPNIDLFQTNCFKTVHFMQSLLNSRFNKVRDGLLNPLPFQSLFSGGLWLFPPTHPYRLGQGQTVKATAQTQKSKTHRHPMTIASDQQGFLLVGPPGTGKTLLVKALAGETQVPILVASAQKLVPKSNQPDEAADNIQQAMLLKNLFYLAKKQSPCILFLDEIDSIGQNRKDVLTKSPRERLTRGSKSIDLLYLSKHTQQNHGSVSDKFTTDQNAFYSNNWNIFNPIIPYRSSDVQHQKRKSVAAKSLSMLTQLLCELDGITNRKDIIIIGTTNRPSILDPALIRPGRLNKILYLDLPNKQKRFELLTFYSTLGMQKEINWDFFANQTFGFSGAHLAAAMNLSALKTIAYDLDVKNTILFYSQVLKGFQKTVQRPNDTWGSDFFSLFSNQTSATHPPIEKQQEKILLNKKPKHNFKTIEHGIQTIQSNFSFQTNTVDRTKQTGYQIGQIKLYPKGYQTNYLIFGTSVYFNLAHLFLFQNQLLKNKNGNFLYPCYNNQLINLFGFNDLSSYLFIQQYKYFKPKTLQSFIKKQRHLTDKQKQQRTLFYQKHKKYLRSLYLLTHQGSKPYLNTPEKQQVDEKKTQLNQFAMFNQFIPKLIKFHLFGCQLLINSTYAIKNPLLFSLTAFPFYKPFFLSKQPRFPFHTMANKFNKKKKHNADTMDLEKHALFNHLNVIKYKLLFSTKQGLLQTNFNKFKLGRQLFTDPYCLNRISYYLSGKALVFCFLKEKRTLSTLSLWSTLQTITRQKVSTKTYINQVNKQFVTKYQFENYLLLLISGKASEFLLLQNYQCTNYSNIGINELQQIGWVLRLMIEKHLFYKPFEISHLKWLTILPFSKKDKVPMHEKDINTVIYLKSLEDNQKYKRHIDPVQRNKNQALFKNQNLWDDCYWWQINLQTHYCRLQLQYGHWSCFFNNQQKDSAEESVNHLPIVFVPDNYFSNLMKHLVIFNNFYATQLNKNSNNGPSLNQMQLSEQQLDNLNVHNQNLVTQNPPTEENREDLDANNQNLLTQNPPTEENINHVNCFSSYLAKPFKEQQTKPNELINKHKINSVNQQFLMGLLQNSEISWNTFQLNHFDAIMSNLLFDSFNKTFSLLENHRELVDLFTYYLLCNESLYDFEVDKLGKMYFSTFEQETQDEPVTQPSTVE